MGLSYYLWIVAPEQVSVKLDLRETSYVLLSPGYLGLVCLLPYLWLVHRSSLVDLSGAQRVMSLFVRAALLVLIATALSRPSTISHENRVSTAFLVDVSQSISAGQLAKAAQLFDRYYAARGDNDVQLITFAKEPRAHDLASKDSGTAKVTRHLRGAEHTDIQAAIQHAYGLFPENLVPRIAILSDGNETAGDLLAESYRAAERGVQLNILKLPERNERELMINELRLPKDVRMGAPFALEATIFSSHPAKATLTLYKDEFINGLEGQKQVQLERGLNRVQFKSLVRESGFVNYRLALKTAARDTFNSNNTSTATLVVLGRPRVLYVEGEPLYAGYLKTALENEKFEVVVRGPHGLPSTAAQLAKFDAVILSDVAATYVSLGQMAAIQSYVRDLGGGFIMIGGQNSFGAGGYYGTRLEKILPVRFDTERKRSQPSLGLVLCIDRSGSMSGTKMALAKEAAKATAELLGSSDLLGVLAFDSSVHNTVRLQRASNRLRIINNISGLRSGGGTNIRPCLQEAFNQLQLASAKVKHVILLSDGQSSYSGIPELVDEMVGQRITVTAVGVGGGADRTLLQMIAERGNGRFYHTDDANNIPKIFTKETTKVARSALVEELVKARVAKHANVIKGINIAGSPFLRGYVSTKAKRLSEVILVSDYGEPLLALWRVGLGKTAAFTSDAKSRWAVDWLRWPGYAKFWSQLVREIMRHRINRSFEMTATAQSGHVDVRVDAIDRQDRFINGLDSTITVFDPTKPQQKWTYPLRQTAAGRYAARFKLKKYGSFLVRAKHRLNGKVVAESLATVAVPYPEEYLRWGVAEERLRRAATISGGRISPTPEQLFAPAARRVRYHKDLWPLFLYVIIGLLFLDILLRRIRLFGYRDVSTG